jgi:alpha-methylacyl-CoA racemase
MLLGDLGAEVLRIDRAHPGPNGAGPGTAEHGRDVCHRGRRAIALDLKNPAATELVLDLVGRCDVLLEGFRPGVMERLGLGPDVCLRRNPRLVYGRMTGWGQDGGLARAPGHDINYIAVAGVLHGFGQSGSRPRPPANLVGDFGGGGMLLGFGVMCALFERNRSGQGQVVDAAMVDGAALLSTFLHGWLERGDWCDERGVNVLDGGAPFYDTYLTADGKYMAVGAVEPNFYAELISLLDVDVDVSQQNNRATWAETRMKMAAAFRQHTRDEWCALFDGTQTCVAPVLTMREAPHHPHNAARGTFAPVDGYIQPAPAPRFSRTPAGLPSPPPPTVRRGTQPLAEWQADAALVDAAIAAGAMAR